MKWGMRYNCNGIVGVNWGLRYQLPADAKCELECELGVGEQLPWDVMCELGHEVTTASGR